MQMDVLRCKTPEMVEKEIWAHLLAYNLLRTVMAVAAAEHGIEPRQVSFKGAKQAVTAFAPKIEAARPEDRPALIDALLAVIAYHRVGDRPGRWEPRARKRRPKPGARLNADHEPRPGCRRIARNGSKASAIRRPYRRAQRCSLFWFENVGKLTQQPVPSPRSTAARGYFSFPSERGAPRAGAARPGLGVVGSVPDRMTGDRRAQPLYSASPSWCSTLVSLVEGN